MPVPLASFWWCPCYGPLLGMRLEIGTYRGPCIGAHEACLKSQQLRWDLRKVCVEEWIPFWVSVKRSGLDHVYEGYVDIVYGLLY